VGGKKGEEEEEEGEEGKEQGGGLASLCHWDGDRMKSRMREVRGRGEDELVLPEEWNRESVGGGRK